MKQYITLAFLFLAIWGNAGAQTALSSLPSDMFGSGNTAMNTQKAKPKKKPKGLGEHAVHLDDSNNPAVGNAIEMLNEGNVEAAKIQFDRLDESDAAAAFGLATAHYLQGELDAALAALAHVPENDSDARYLKGLIYTDQGNYDLAEETFHALIEAHPDDLDSWDALGWLYFSAGIDEAAAVCKKVILEINPEYEMSY